MQSLPAAYSAVGGGLDQPAQLLASFRQTPSWRRAGLQLRGLQNPRLAPSAIAFGFLHHHQQSRSAASILSLREPQQDSKRRPFSLRGLDFDPASMRLDNHFALEHTDPDA